MTVHRLPEKAARAPRRRRSEREAKPVRVRCHRLKDGSDGCLPGFVTPLHGDPARGHGVEKEWD